MKKTVHKVLKPSGFVNRKHTYCGQVVYDYHATWVWVDVTCETCLANRPKQTMHRRLDFISNFTRCGLFLNEFTGIKNSRDWKEVTCKTCLSMEGKGKE